MLVIIHFSALKFSQLAKLCDFLELSQMLDVDVIHHRDDV